MKKVYTQERPIEQQACMWFVGVSVVMATLGFWSKGLLPGALLTVAMVVVVLLLSRFMERVREAWETRNYATAVIAAGLALGFAVMEANLNHIGLAKLDADYDVVPDGFVNLGFMQIGFDWIACYFISAVNIFASYAYARQLEDRRVQPAPINPGKLLVELREQKKRAA